MRIINCRIRDIKPYRDIFAPKTEKYVENTWENIAVIVAVDALYKITDM